jgi:hypothetical protein
VATTFIGITATPSRRYVDGAEHLARRQPALVADGARIAFDATPGTGGAPASLGARHQPWSVWVGDVAVATARQVWKAPETLRGSFPTTHGTTNLHWAAGERIVFLSYEDGWPHLFSVPSAGGTPVLLTPGSYMAEHIRLAPDGRSLVFAANAGQAADDLHRRHVVRAAVDRSLAEVVTPGEGV